MNYLPDGLPIPIVERDDAVYWEGCRNRQLKVQQCTNCRMFRHMPCPVCPACRSLEFQWVEVSGRGTVFSYTVVHYASHPVLREALPYNIAWIQLDDAGDVRLVSNVVDAEPDELAIGMPVVVHWEPISDGGYLPRFRKAI